MTHHNRHKQIALAISVAILGSTLLPAALPTHEADAQVRLRGKVYRTERQANRLFSLGKWEEAEKVYARGVKRAPRNPKYRANHAIVQAELFKLGAAEKSAKKALELDPKNPYAHIALGLVYKNRTASSDMTYRARRYELLNRAIEEFELALKYDANNPDAYNRLGEVYRMLGQSQKADESFSKAIDLDPKFSEALANKGTVLKAQGRLNEAIDHFKRATKLNSKNYKAHYYLGEALADRGEFHEAYEALNTALYQNRNSAMIYTKMGEVLEKQGNESAAISKYREAIRTKPEYVPAYQHLANVFDSRGDGEFAIAELKSALNAYPGLTSLKLDIARLSQSVDKTDQALRYYNEVLQADPANPEALNGLAQTYLSSAEKTAGQGILGGDDKYVDAEVAIKRALQANPDNPQLHLAMLKVSKLAGNPEVARQQLEYIVNQPVHNETERLVKGEALFALDRYPESDRYFRQVLQSYGQDTQRKLLLADMLKTNNDLVMATEVYNNILATDTNNLKAQRGLQRIGKLRSETQKTTNLANSFNNWYSRKQKRSAKDFYLESVSKNPRQAEVRYALAKIFNKEDDYGRAAIEYEAYLNLSPDISPNKKEDLREKIARLKTKAAEQTATAAGKSTYPTQPGSVPATASPNTGGNYQYGTPAKGSGAAPQQSSTRLPMPN